MTLTPLFNTLLAQLPPSISSNKSLPVSFKGSFSKVIDNLPTLSKAAKKVLSGLDRKKLYIFKYRNESLTVYFEEKGNLVINVSTYNKNKQKRNLTIITENNKFKLNNNYQLDKSIIEKNIVDPCIKNIDNILKNGIAEEVKLFDLENPTR